MSPIPKKMREEMSNDPFYKRCCLNGEYPECEGRTEWHHVWIYAGKQIQEKWAIVPACSYHHSLAHNPKIRDAFERVSLLRTDTYDFIGYPRKDWDQIKERLGI